MGLFDDHLSFTSPSGPSALPPPGLHLLISDGVSASANVVLYHLFMSAVSGGVPIIWVDFRQETVASLDTVLRRLGSPLPPSPRLQYISPTPLPPSLHPSSSSQPPLFSPDPTLHPTVTAVREALSHVPAPGAGAGIRPSPSSPFPTSAHASSSAPRSLVILDGLSELADMGFSPAEVTRMVRVLLANVRAAGGSLVSTTHYEEVGGGDEFLRRVLRLGGAWWRVGGITPRSADVSGEISAVTFDGSGPSVPRDKAIQFRLEPAAVKAFPKGTGRGYL